MTYSRRVAIVCFVVITPITPPPPIAWKHPPPASGAGA